MTAAASPLALLNAALSAKLLASADVTAIVGQGVYVVQAPPGSGLPYIILHHISGGDTDDSPRNNANVMYQVLCWSTDYAQAESLNNAVRAALHRQQLTSLDALGWNNYWMVSRGYIHRTEWSENNQSWGEGAEFEIRIDQLGISPPPGLP